MQHLKRPLPHLAMNCGPCVPLTVVKPVGLAVPLDSVSPAGVGNSSSRTPS